MGEQAQPASATGVDPGLFRLVLGHFPTGVVVVTATGREGQPVGMAVSAFTSVSLEPPLVAFLPAMTSKTWPEIEASGGFCVNILSSQQEAWSRSFGRSGTDKFAGASWFPSPGGAPVLEDALAWIDCGLYRVDEAGDHYVVFGEVQDMRLQSGSAPLVYFRGGYGAFESSSLVAGDPYEDLALPLRIVDLGRRVLEEFTERSRTQVAVTALVADQIVVLAVAGATAEDRVSEVFIGQKLRAIPPFGATFMAWEPAERVAAWTGLAPADQTDTLLARLDAVRRRGMAFSLEGGGVGDWRRAMSEAAVADERTRQEMLANLALQTLRIEIDESDAPHVRNLHVPVFGPDGRACLYLNVGGFPALDKDALAELEAEVRDVAGRISKLAAGRAE